MKRTLPPLIALFVSAVMLAFTLGLCVHERDNEQARLRAVFDASARRAAGRIQQRVANYEQMLRGVQGLLSADVGIDRDSFEAYVDTVMAGPDAAGLQGVAFSKLVTPAELDGFVGRQRASGRPEFTVQPEGARDLYAPIVLVAPDSVDNRRVVGFDQLSDATRHAVLLQARDSGNPMLTPLVQLRVDAGSEPRPGCLIYLPVYRQGAPLASVAQRRASAVGWVRAAFRVGDLMSTLYGEQSPGLAVRVYDGVDVQPASLMYRSDTVSDTDAAVRGARFQAREYISLAGHTWTLQLSSLPEFEREYGHQASTVILVAGVLLSLLLGAVAHQLVSGRTRAVAAAQQKMDAIGTLAGGIAHDFNNILAAILGNIAAARQDAAAGKAGDASLLQIERAALRARSLVQQILTFSRVQAQALHTLALQPIVAETLEMLRTTLPAQVDLQVDLPAEPVHARADATQIQQIVMNLVTNAWHALPDGRGRIEVGLAAEHGCAPARADAPWPAALRNGPRAHLWVVDDGCGMDAATQARMFEPFFTTKPVGRGTGLGLAVVHGIVNAHGGAIRVDSAPGAGSRFDLWFPLQDEPEHVAESQFGTLVAPPGGGQRVLCVDDDPAMALVVDGLLSRSGYQVTSIEDPVAALACVQADPGAFDLLVTDHNMPEMTGMELAAAVARAAPGLPVIVTSGFITDGMRRQANALRIGALLQKEYTMERLAGLVHALLEQHRE